MPGRKIEYSTRRLTKLPNVGSALGYDRYTARAGDFILYKESYTDGSSSRRQARVLGVITKCDQDGASGVDLLLVLAFTDDLSYGYERWVEPKDVLSCKGPEHARAFLSWIVGAEPEELWKYCRDDLETRRKASCHYFVLDRGVAGTSTVDRCSICARPKADPHHVRED